MEQRTSIGTPCLIIKFLPQPIEFHNYLSFALGGKATPTIECRVLIWASSNKSPRQ